MLATGLSGSPFELLAINIQGVQETFDGFHGHGDTPIAGWFIGEHPTKMDDD